MIHNRHPFMTFRIRTRSRLFPSLFRSCRRWDVYPHICKNLRASEVTASGGKLSINRAGVRTLRLICWISSVGVELVDVTVRPIRPIRGYRERTNAFLRVRETLDGNSLDR